MYELERNAVGTQVTVYTETALQAVIRESREEVEFTNAAGEVFEPRYKWIASFDEGVYNFEAFATVIDVNAEIASKEPNKARLLWAKLDEWRAFDTLTRSSVVVMGRLRELETEFAHRTEVVPESAEDEKNDEADEGVKHWTGDDTCTCAQRHAAMCHRAHHLQHPRHPCAAGAIPLSRPGAARAQVSHLAAAAHTEPA